jgi:glycosyltransferase involved in cell wall biosynthesis
MRILFINERVDYSNATSYSLDLASALVERGHEVQVCTLGGDLINQFRERSIETYEVSFNMLSMRKLMGYLGGFNPDLVHVQSFRSYEFGRKITSRLEKPVVLTVHTRPAAGVRRLKDRNLCGAIAASEVIREGLVNELDMDKSRVRVIARGIDLAAFQPGKSDYWSPDDKRLPVVACVGQLSEEKGQHLLIRAAKLVLDQGIDAHFAIVGDGDTAASLHNLVKELGLELNVTFSPHIAGRQALYGLFDIMAMPVLRGGVGVGAIEAMAMGRPLITTGVGEMLDLVQDGETGLLVPEGDVEALAAKILELLRNPSEISRLGESARRWVERDFVLEPMVDDTIEFYSECLDRIEEESSI